MTVSPVGIAAALGATASWALCGVLFKRLGERLEPLGMTAVKAVLAALLLAPVVWGVYGFTSLGVREAGLLAASGFLGIAIGDSLFFAALAELSPLLLTILLFAGPNLFSGLLGVLCLGEMPSLWTWCGIGVVMAAMALLVFPVNMDDKGKSTVKGIILAVLSLIFTSLSMVMVKSVLKGMPSLEATMWRMAAGGVALVVYGLVSGRLRTWGGVFGDKRYAAGFVGVTALVAFGGFGLSLAAIKYLDLVVASALMSLEPLFVLPFMICFGHHRTCAREIAGMALAVAGVLLIALKG